MDMARKRGCGRGVTEVCLESFGFHIKEWGFILYIVESHQLFQDKGITCLEEIRERIFLWLALVCVKNNYVIE